jgi:hypothetical protein
MTISSQNTHQNAYQHMAKYLFEALKSRNGPLHYFYQQMYNIPRGGIRFESPDISGYTLMFMQPPHLSGYGLSEHYGGELGDICKFLCFAGVDFTPPNTQVSASELPSRSGSINFGTEVSISGQLTISYLDNQNSAVFSFHKLWVNYIEDILRGKNSKTGANIAPHSEYYDEWGTRFGQIDYMTSAYVIRFKPSMTSTTAEINYIGKATGIFPLNIPDKEEIGRRDSPEMIMVPITYSCTFYRQRSPFQDPHLEQHEYLYKEFSDLVASVYSS